MGDPARSAVSSLAALACDGPWSFVPEHTMPPLLAWHAGNDPKAETQRLAFA